MEDRVVGLVIDAGTEAFHALMEEERMRLCDPPFAATDPSMRLRRAGHAPGTIVLADRRIAVRRARVCLPSGSHIVLQSWQYFAEDPLQGTGIRDILLEAAQFRDAIPVPTPIPEIPASREAAHGYFRSLTAILLARALREKLERLKISLIQVEALVVQGAPLLVAVAVDATGNHIIGVRSDEAPASQVRPTLADSAAAELQ